MRLRRRGQSEQDPDDRPEGSAEPGEGDGDSSGGAAAVDAGQGPFDSDDVPDDGREWVDLGGLRIAPTEGFDLRLQVDEASGEVMSVLLTTEEGAVEMRPFAAPRTAGTWDEVRREIAAETSRRGGTATETEGPFGVELHTAMPVQTPDGQSAYQPARVVGIDGPRWLLRGTLLGRPAVDPEAAAPYEEALRSVAVHRGSDAMAPGEPLPLHVPPQAQRMA